jgi:hypothetical protein
MHQLAKDYLEKKYKTRLQLASPVQGYTEFGRRSINTMSSILRQNL